MAHLLRTAQDEGSLVEPNISGHNGSVSGELVEESLNRKIPNVKENTWTLSYLEELCANM